MKKFKPSTELDYAFSKRSFRMLYAIPASLRAHTRWRIGFAHRLRVKRVVIEVGTAAGTKLYRPGDAVDGPRFMGLPVEWVDADVFQCRADSPNGEVWVSR